ncbi:unnamed protein product [Hymenolepis diminuta]|uniref:Uncharacterized protein n=1 Tax=Hymenolepis diminuta TaxID=6216 RepID=A0A0R3SHN8_HYMDI|nr:unnamed protein product [Hymenolepis diminuta]
MLVQTVSKAGTVNGEFGLREDDETEWSGVGEEGLQRLLMCARLLGRRMEGERTEAHDCHEFTTKVHASGPLKFYSPACISPGYTMLTFEDPSEIINNYLMLFYSNIGQNSIGILRKWRRKYVSGLQPPTSGVANISWYYSK